MGRFWCSLSTPQEHSSGSTRVLSLTGNISGLSQNIWDSTCEAAIFCVSIFREELKLTTENADESRIFNPFPSNTWGAKCMAQFWCHQQQGEQMLKSSPPQASPASSTSTFHQSCFEGWKFTSYKLKLNGSQANPPSLDFSKHFLKPLCSPGLTLPTTSDLLTVWKDFMALSAVGDHHKGSGHTAGSGLQVSSPKFTATLSLFQAARASYSPNGSLSLAFFKRSRNSLCLADGLG